MGFVVWRRAARGGLPRTWRRPIQHGELTRPVHHAAVRCDQRRRRSVSIHGVSRPQSVSQSRWPRCRDAEQRPPDHPQSRRRYCFDLVREVCRHRRRTSDETKPSRLRHRDREWDRNLDQYFGARFTKYLTIILWLSYDNAKVTVDFSRERFTWKIVRSSEIAFVY